MSYADRLATVAALENDATRLYHFTRQALATLEFWGVPPPTEIRNTSNSLSLRWWESNRLLCEVECICGIAHLWLYAHRFDRDSCETIVQEGGSSWPADGVAGFVTRALLAAQELQLAKPIPLAQAERMGPPALVALRILSDEAVPIFGGLASCVALLRAILEDAKP